MDASEYLHRVASARKKADGLRRQQRILEQMANNVPGGTFDEPKPQGKGTSQAPFVKWIDRILDAEKAANDAESEFRMLAAEAVGAIRKMQTLPLQNLLIMRYVEGSAWEDIADSLGIVRQTCWRWHGAALFELDAVLTSGG